MIDKDPNKVDIKTEKPKQGERKTYKIKESRFPLIEEVNKIYLETHDDYKQYVILASEATHTAFMRAKTPVTGNEEKFFQSFINNLKALGDSINKKSETSGESEAKETKQTNPLSEQIFTIKKPNRKLTLELPVMPERKRRKQINFINLKTLIDLYLAEERKGSDLKPTTLRFVQTVDEIGTKKEVVLESDLLVKKIITGLSEVSNPSDNDNFYKYIEEFLSALISRIGESSKVFNTASLVSMCKGMQSELKEEIDGLYLKLYKKIGEKPVKLPSKKGTPSVNLSSEHDKLSILYISKDSDVQKMKEKINYYKFIGID